jgi:Carbonic anhydrase
MRSLLQLGQLFVHRNVGNQVVNTDLNFITVLTYAVEYLKVKVCSAYIMTANFVKQLVHEQWPNVA